MNRPQYECRNCNGIGQFRAVIEGRVNYSECHRCKGTGVIHIDTTTGQPLAGPVGFAPEKVKA